MTARPLPLPVALAMALCVASACRGGSDDKTSVSTSTTVDEPATTDDVTTTDEVTVTDTATDTTPPPLDVSERLGAGEVRAGVITDDDALFAGVSAEGRPGDIKLYNDRVQFVIQALGDSSYYLSDGGTVVDADIVRPEGELGRDLVDEWSPMYGLGRVLGAESLEIVDDGRDGGPAVVRVSGYEAPLGLIEGALENEGFVAELGLQITTEYRLSPDSWLLEVRSTLTATDGDVQVNPADILMGAPEVGSPYTERIGLGDGFVLDPLFTAYVAHHNDVAVAMIPSVDQPTSSLGYELLTSLADMAVAAVPMQSIADGESFTFVRYYGVGPSLSVITDAALALHGTATSTESGVVTAPDGPVAGARVNLLVDGAPFTAAVSGDDGSYEAMVPDGGAVTTIVDGRGTGRFFDLPPGSVAYAPYAATDVRDATTTALREGAPGPAWPMGRGVASSTTLGEPAWIRVVSDHALPFTARIGFAAGDPALVDDRLVAGRPDGLAAAGWSTRGELLLAVEPGSYEVLVHRGLRHELHTESITVAAGDEVLVEAALATAYDHEGWLLADPHSHASPSADGGITMEERLAVAAGVGIQLHFGTDHDHLADYRPLIAPLGLLDVLGTVVSDEVSPPLRGHMNIYPVQPDSDQANGGSFRWWTEIPESTDALVTALRARHGDEFVLQLNHPLDSGVGDAAGWSPGLIEDSNRWTDRFDAMEVLNAADTEEYLSIWWDVVLRGSEAVPTGVSDSHSHFGGTVGMSATWIHTGVDSPALVTDSALAGAFRSGEVVVTRGPWLDLSVLPGHVASGTEVAVEAHAPSWIVVDRLELWRDGAVEQTIDATSGTFTLAPDADAVYVITAVGDTPMQPITSRTPWAMTAPYRVDVGGDGFTPPLPPLTIE